MSLECKIKNLVIVTWNKYAKSDTLGNELRFEVFILNNSPIGIFDSGVGGLTVVRDLINKLPEESFIYYGDTAHVPYGNKTREQLFFYTREIMSYFMERKVKAIVVACNTSSSVTLPTLEKEYDIPMLGVVKPGARAAVATTRNGRIGVLATLATVNSQAYRYEIEALCPEAEVSQCACSRFVPLIEAGVLEGEEICSAVRDYVSPMLNKGIDTLVLGCTHYPFIAPIIEAITGAGVKLVDPAEETVNEMKTIMMQNNIMAASRNPTREFVVSGNAESFYEVGRMMLGDIFEKGAIPGSI
jgi:glutamate racemase